MKFRSVPKHYHENLDPHRSTIVFSPVPWYGSTASEATKPSITIPLVLIISNISFQGALYVVYGIVYY